MTTFEATVTSKGQVTIPSRLRAGLRLQPGDKLVFTQDAQGEIRVQAKAHSLADLRGIIGRGMHGLTSDMVEEWIGQSREARWRAAEEDD